MKKNKVLMLLTVLCALVSISINVWKGSKNDDFRDVVLNQLDALANDETGDHITCYCALASDNNCAANNNGSSKCAGGTNIKCWEYDRNCN
ncbi:hypothetical protein SAMN05444349_101143 [Bacteroides faecichinchillae]|uniref:NVEALA protein n=1 Tax=Bacteroides faecichinchillae TaxID=871325 RepID=A0A1M4SIC7_9BACE|nr:hypothetical protein [Bacteroides faecichinchillae]THG68149.1 hypothetical protein E5981_05895 [Bacteroides faecichinchillae]SHE31908.1 hypothetical protein SAMN05444349_101143 [Bacteroides faecichinchillae]